MSPSKISLDGMTVGISISDSEDLEALGMDKVVLDLAYLEIARHLLAHGARLAYGGDHREKGFSEILFDLIQTYNQPGQDVSDRTINYLAWPLYLNLSKERRVELLDVARIVEVPLDDDLRREFDLDEKSFLPPDATDSRYVWAHSLTKMRELMNAEIDARVVLGGQTGRFLGRYPGIAEEALIALDSNMPVYLLGGFGGCAGELIDALQGREPGRLSADYQMTRSEHATAYSDLFHYYNKRHADAPIDYEELTDRFARAGMAGLNNQLNERGNQRLFLTDDVDEMVALTLMGLSKIRSLKA